ncbi:DUF3572 domain-containing protein [Pseudooctadecabacter jejudonensis]|uniref:DUF3572 domain-containing protein n=1 Tax=Pseudooctadecabacter jejudonensis TaxID=1391910 RepID=A0A1Y5RV09_9RHOB|nr:DUF3572 domain-containing protein [Pseudooctadecabacter jejudonensis]SLN23214.1 hypothetical protein PSJ8397_00975 [Pseudooctadecabacter jejudonensis]
MSPDRAEHIAIAALIWLSTNEELLPVFLGSSGASAQDLRAQAESPAFLASVLEFITMDDTWVMTFCDAEGLKYEDPLMARYALPGAEAVHWT